MKMYNKEEVYKVAKQLIDGLDNNIEEVVVGLERIIQDENITLEEINEQCWEDSATVFDRIYGC